MDTKWLIAIVIANVIAAIVKESVTGVIKRIPAMTATLKAKLITRVIPILRKNCRQLLIGFDVFMWIFSGLAVAWLVYLSATPLTKQLVMSIGIHCGAWFYWQRQAMRDWERYLAWRYPAA